MVGHPYMECLSEWEIELHVRAFFSANCFVPLLVEVVAKCAVCAINAFLFVLKLVVVGGSFGAYDRFLVYLL